MTSSPPLPAVERERDAVRSREAILDAAEQLFAERGFDATSLSDVGHAAGVSRGTPGYFFGSKADLYRAVLERCFAQSTEAIRAGRARALASREPRDKILAGLVGDYFEFLADRPNMVRLMERLALGEGPAMEGNAAEGIGQEALAALMDELGFERRRAREAAHLLLSILALCWFPLVHRATYVASVGLKADSRSYDDERKRFVIDLILNGVKDRLP
jgi:AcrR family transcriptional regulator